MSRNKVVLIGCGRIGERHAEKIHQLGELIAVCDVEESRAVQLASVYHVPYFTSLKDLLLSKPQADLFSICTPNGLHAEHSISCLNAGYHVLCEKPMAITSVDCGKMIQAAEQNNKRLFIVKQNRFNPPVQAVKNALVENKLGTILSFQLNCFWNRNSQYYQNSWKGTKLLDGGTLFTQFSHFIDLLYWFFGDITETKAYLDNYIHQGMIEFEDSGVVILKFANNVSGAINYNVNSYGKNMEGSLTIFGEKGTVKIGGQYLNELEYQNIENFSIENLPKGNPPNSYGQYVGSMSNHEQVYQNLFNTLDGKESIMTNSFEGLKTVEIIEKIYASAQH
jgi:UDP-N-acetyl-2-amino-2-deoxyglucuronate dehydrogenase